MDVLEVLVSITNLAKSENWSDDCFRGGGLNLASMASTAVWISWFVKDIKGDEMISSLQLWFVNQPRWIMLWHSSNWFEIWLFLVWPRVSRMRSGELSQRICMHRTKAKMVQALIGDDMSFVLYFEDGKLSLSSISQSHYLICCRDRIREAVGEYQTSEMLNVTALRSQNRTVASHQLRTNRQHSLSVCVIVHDCMYSWSQKSRQCWCARLQQIWWKLFLGFFRVLRHFVDHVKRMLSNLICCWFITSTFGAAINQQHISTTLDSTHTGGVPSSETAHRKDSEFDWTSTVVTFQSRTCIPWHFLSRVYWTSCDKPWLPLLDIFMAGVQDKYPTVTCLIKSFRILESPAEADFGSLYPLISTEKQKVTRTSNFFQDWCSNLQPQIPAESDTPHETATWQRADPCCAIFLAYGRLLDWFISFPVAILLLIIISTRNESRWRSRNRGEFTSNSVAD